MRLHERSTKSPSRPAPLIWGGRDERISEGKLMEYPGSFVERHQGVERLLLLLQDMTRLNSRSGEITAFLDYHYKDRAQVRIMPALGTNFPMTVAANIK